MEDADFGEIGQRVVTEERQHKFVVMSKSFSASEVQSLKCFCTDSFGEILVSSRSNKILVEREETKSFHILNTLQIL